MEKQFDKKILNLVKERLGLKEDCYVQSVNINATIDGLTRIEVDIVLDPKK